MKNYIYEFKDLLDLQSYEIEKWFCERDAIKLADLKVKDLVFYNKKAIHTGNGVYLFRERDRIIYVGKCSARNFVERIPAHFDVRHNGWFNSMLIRLIRRDITIEKSKVKTDENLIKAANYSFENLELILINFSIYDKHKINRLETFLRMTVNPLNGFKIKTLDTKYKTVREYVCEK